MGRPEPMFDRYGEWPERPLAVPDPNARATYGGNHTTSVALPEGYGTTLVLAPTDPLEIERQELGL